VFGIFHTHKQVERGVEDLTSAGFRGDAIAVLLPDRDNSRDFAHEKNTKAPEGATAGVTVGGMIGGTLGLLAAIGFLVIPELDPFLAAGPVVTTLAGMGAGGAAGGMIGALVGMGMPEYEAKRFAGRIKDGGILFSVHCETAKEVERAKELLKQTGAQGIASSTESSADFAAVMSNVQ
jgi:hypothetical protein